MEGWLIRQELGDSLRVPIALLALFAIIMAYWFERTQVVTSSLLVLGMPLIALRMATRSARDSELPLARAAIWLAFATGALALLALLQSVVAPALGFAVSLLPTNSVLLLLGLAALAAIPLEALLARSGVESRLSAWSALVAAFAGFTPWMRGGDSLEALFGAVTFAVVLGGGVGLALGALARRFVGARA